MATKTKKKKATSGKRFAWRDGSRFKVTAQIAGDELDRIARENNTPVPHVAAQVLVDESRPEAAPLHPEFTWDDQIAAEAYRVNEARNIIRSIRVVENEENGVSAAPNWVSVKLSDTNESAYVETVTAWSEEAMRKQVLADAIGQLRGLKARYKHLSELGEVFEAIDRLPDPE
jgi:hypothetical protein